MDGRRIAISKTGLLSATIGSFLHVLACTYVCTSAVTRLRSQLQQTSENNRGDRAPITPIKGLPSLT